MPAKLTIQNVRKIFEEAGCKLISDKYYNNKTKLQFICSCHIHEENPVIHEILFITFKNGARCEDCRNRRTKDTMIEHHGVTHLTQIPEKKEQMLSGIKKYVKEKKHKLEDLQIIYVNQGCKLLATEYINNTVRMPFICICDRIYENTYDEFQQGQRCGFQDCINKRTQKTHVKNYGMNYSLTEEYKERSKNTSQRNYNTDHPSQSDVVKQIKKDICLKLYDKEYYFQTDDFKTKTKLHYIKWNIKKAKIDLNKDSKRIINIYGIDNVNRPKIDSNKRIMDIYGIDNVKIVSF
jgi:hypothetical protein